MSHLQPKFVAKAKSSMKQARAPRSMPRKMRLDEARAIDRASRRDCLGWSIWDTTLDHRVFTLKK